MRLLIDSLWRAALYCVHPRVMALSLLPLVLMVVLAWVLGYFFWDAAVAWVRHALEASSLLQLLWHWLEGVGAAGLKSVVAPLIVIFLSTPLLVIAALLLVSLLMTPTLTRMVASRRFPNLERKQGSGFWLSLGWALLSTLLALLALLISLPLWLVPPLAMLLPPVIWGWLTYRIMAFDVLADFASREERQALLARHRMRLLGMGIASGLLGAAPGMVWASGALFAAAFVILVPVAIWIDMLVLSFTAMWFAHYALAALVQSRQQETASKQSGFDSGECGEVMDVPSRTLADGTPASAQVASQHASNDPPTPS